MSLFVYVGILPCFRGVIPHLAGFVLLSGHSNGLKAFSIILIKNKRLQVEKQTTNTTTKTISSKQKTKKPQLIKQTNDNNKNYISNNKQQQHQQQKHTRLYKQTNKQTNKRQQQKRHIRLNQVLGKPARCHFHEPTFFRELANAGKILGDVLFHLRKTVLHFFLQNHTSDLHK